MGYATWIWFASDIVADILDTFAPQPQISDESLPFVNATLSQ
jgi:hypothetical protein